MKRNSKRRHSKGLGGIFPENISEGQEEKGVESLRFLSDSLRSECQDQPKDDTIIYHSYLVGTSRTIKEPNTDVEELHRVAPQVEQLKTVGERMEKQNKKYTQHFSLSKEIDQMKLQQRKLVEIIQKTPNEFDQIKPFSHINFPSVNFVKPWRNVNRFAPLKAASSTDDPLDLLTSGIKVEESHPRKETLTKSLKQADNPAAGEEQLKRPEDLDPFYIFPPRALRQPLITDSSENKEASICLMDENISPTSDLTQSYSVPNRSARTDHLHTSESDVRRRDCGFFSRSLSWSFSLQEPPAVVSNFPRAPSLPDQDSHSSFEEFTPDVTGDEDDEPFWFQCSGPGLYQCRVSGLVFDMKGQGDVFYRIVPWNRRLLSQHDKKPAGPLFDIRCQQQTVAQLHLPHCEIRSTGGCHFLSVAHVQDEGIEFIRPEKITETHVIISISGFSAFGNVKDEDSPPDPVRALVLLFYKPPAGPESDRLINVLMLPKNVVLRNVVRFRKRLDEDERFLETPSDCRLQPDRLYCLSTCPGKNLVLVQPTEEKLDRENYKYYFPSFNVTLKAHIGDITLRLVEKNSFSSVWKQDVHLLPAEAKTSFFSNEKLKKKKGGITYRRSGAEANPGGGELHFPSPAFSLSDDQSDLHIKSDQGQKSSSDLSVGSSWNYFYPLQKMRKKRERTETQKRRAAKVWSTRKRGTCEGIQKSTSETEERAPSIHPSDVPFHFMQGCGVDWAYLQGPWGERWGTPWTGRQSIAEERGQEPQSKLFDQIKLSVHALAQELHLPTQHCQKEPPAVVSNFPRAPSLPNLKLHSSFEEFTPDVTGDEDDETYWFQCSGPGLYQCRVSGLVFDMKGQGDVFYRIVPWNRRLLSQLDKKPAGPLFDIRCQQQTVAQLHLPHCEIRSTGGCHFLSVAHVQDEGIEFIRPEKITETHVIISISGFSAFGNVKDEDSPPDPVRALVLLFYKPPAGHNVTSFLNVFLLPRNIVIRELKQTMEDELFIKTPPHCKLQPDQVYTLSTSPGDDLVKVQPKEAEFDGEYYKDYFSSFQVTLKALIRDINLKLVEKSSSCCVWEGDCHLLPSKAKTSIFSSDQLKEIQSSIIDRISGPTLKRLLDKLQQKNMMTEDECEEAMEKSRCDKARYIIDTVRRKEGTAEMIEILCDIDPFLSKTLKLI